MGLLLAGLLAAFMSTFAGTLNAAQAYIVNDIYLKYLKPDASRRQISRTNYLTGIVVVTIQCYLRLLCHGCKQCAAVDRIGPVGSLCGFQYAEMVLVAL